MIPRPLLWVLIVCITIVWIIATFADIRSTNYDATGVHLIFGSVVGGLIGLDQKQQRNGGEKDEE